DAKIPPERYTIRIPDRLPPLRMGRLRLEVALRQVIDNAVKFHPEHAPRVEITVEQPDDAHVRLTVADDGPGIPSDELPRIWLPFYQVDSLHTGQVPGLGLGLPLTAHHVWSVGGDVGIESKLGQGTRVWLDIPVADGPA
ncbi:MAG: ATP-binding protein, partial [Anaerolineae bacterium]|nr:ATP-binding protein [Anaerolineae bacterium]